MTQFILAARGYNIISLDFTDRKVPRFSRGIFNIDSISGGLLIGNTDYRGNHESSYLNFSYRCATEKYKLDLATKEFKIAYRSDLLKKNDKTGVYEKVVK